jgi:hypothetical protein
MTGKKAIGTKAEIRAKKQLERRLASLVFLALLTLAVGSSAYVIYDSLNLSSDLTFSGLRAAIVDHLSLTFPNQTFVEMATKILRQANYTVDYYPGEETTVNFYRNLPTYGYKILILRVHSSATVWGSSEGPVAFFTSERYDQTRHVSEQLTDQLSKSVYSEDEMSKGIVYFGIYPSFVTRSLNGKWRNTTVIMMGCEGLRNTGMAQAFIEKGARAYIGWNRPVTASHTDTATVHLLRQLLAEKRTIRDSLKNTFSEVGSDPQHESLLLCYPPEVVTKTIENLQGNS